MMKTYKSKRIFCLKNKIMLILFCVFVVDIFLILFFKDNLGYKISYTAKIKIEELTRYYLNSTIKKFLNLDINNYININYVNNNIVSVDIDNNKANVLLFKIIESLEENIYEIEKGKIEKYHNLEMLRASDGIVVFMPLGVVSNSSLFSRLGPKIPVKISFLENINAFVDVDVENYGINNSLIKLYININIEEVIELPIVKETENIEYKFLIASKLINGKVPSMLGGVIESNSGIVNNSVK